MTFSSRALLDANVLVYAAVPSSHQHAASLALCQRALDEASGEFCVTSQVLFEYFSTITNSRRVVPSSTLEDAVADLLRYRHALAVIKPPPTLIEDVTELVMTLHLTSADIFDLVLAATMLANGVTTVYSYDAGVFGRVPGITVREP